MSFVDLLLIALALLFALSGFRQGLLVSATSIVGFLGGAVLGAQLSGAVADRIDGSSVTRVFAALVVVLAGALLGQILAGAAGRALRSRVTWEPAKMVDSVAGAVVSAAAVLLVAWMVASPLASSPFPAVSSQVRQSALVQAVDRAVPDERAVGLQQPARRDRPARAARRPRPAHAHAGARRARARPGAARQPRRRPRCRTRWSRSAASRRPAPGRSTARASSTPPSG